MQKVYVVFYTESWNGGSSSRPMAAFPDESLAKRYAKGRGWYGSDADVREVDLYDSDEALQMAGVQLR